MTWCSRTLFDADLDAVADSLDAAIPIYCGRSADEPTFRRVWGIKKTRLSLVFFMVELRGIEPLTFSMRTRRATNCAIAPRR